MDHKKIKLSLEDIEKIRHEQLKNTKGIQHKRVFCNRPLRLDRINWLGFDLDYTLALYKTPIYDEMTYGLLRDGLLKLGFPKSIENLKYDPNFVVRGILVDVHLGNFVKLDKFTEIVVCYHGRTKVDKKTTSEIYEALRISTEDIGTDRFSLANTSYDIPRAALYADLIHHFEQGASDCVVLSNGRVNYQNLWEDLCKVMDGIHAKTLKDETLAHLDKYVEGGTLLAQVLAKLREAGKKLFLLTNSPFFYAQGVMIWLLNGKLAEYPNWTDYFDVIIIDAQKPNFFLGNTKFRENGPQGHHKLDVVESLKKGVIYSHGNLTDFENLCGITAGNSVLYVGDHIFSDVLISKKKHGWRTLLIIPELQQEESIGREKVEAFRELLQLAEIKHSFFASLDVKTTSVDIEVLKKLMTEARENFDKLFNIYFGGMFRNGLHTSFFAMQVGRYADLYTSKVWNLLLYALATYSFTPHLQGLPHELELERRF